MPSIGGILHPVPPFTAMLMPLCIVIVLSVTKLNISGIIVIMLNVVMLNVVMLSFIMPRDFKLIVEC